MEGQENKPVETPDARKASESRVTTLDNILSEVTKPVEIPASEEVQSEKDVQVSDKKEEPKEHPAQKRIRELTAKRKEAEKAATEASKEVNELRARIKALETARPAEEAVKPQRHDFTSEGDYIEALTDYKAQRAILAEKEQQQQAKVEAENQEREARYRKTVEVAKTRYEDFDKVVGEANIKIKPHMVLALQESEIGADLVYYLASNPDEAHKINEMSPIRAIKYIHHLEADLLAPEPEEKVVKDEKPKVTKKAPEPITPVRGLNAIMTENSTSFADYKAKRLAAMRK